MNTGNKNVVLFCIGGESLTLIPIILGVVPFLAGLLLIFFSRRLSVGTARIFLMKTGEMRHVAAFRTLYIVLGIFILFAGIIGFMSSFVLGC